MVRISGSTFSLRVIAGAIILLFFYYAQGVVITLLLSILLAYFLDPAVEFLEKTGLPRTGGAMVMVLILIMVLVAVGYGLGTRMADFAENWPKYSSVLRGAAESIEGKINGIEGRVAPGNGPGGQPSEVRPLEPGLLRAMILRGAGSLYAIFIPRNAAYASQGNAGGFARSLARLPGWHEYRRRHGDCREQLVFLALGPGLSHFDGHRVGATEHGALYRCGDGVVSRIRHRVGESQVHWLVCLNRGGADGHSCGGGEFHRSGSGRPPGSTQRSRDHSRPFVLGMGMGRHGAVAGYSHYGDLARNLRPHRILAADWPLVERLN
jgi:AI-2E family transporter